ncbi:TetR/AcrR family transcriptional regulator [Mycobacterium parmense]|uniref:Putative transcriptional regulator, TetR family protein n=1 Tax=Mycobacterium parmense TaxID=185642 RepID=A0A7I7YQM1_9MYCO|nr:TetR/AcrR family transcriptional regulator [Mycobacterium parmense]MCV7353678.1 TetR/AcrR family transcriptional regulator [Mycobacterium parmense]ORW61190.1 TetR family transcriptional regulator [Mycobacterium parmense]BBZ43454.1 putative transcriptional regulator, TetR family protein [Mycobacterium parmense]
MPRVVKHPDIRRAELLDRASELFLRHGYDNVSLNDVIADAGVSKGAFYHWFPSKDSLVAALAERSAREAFARVEHAVEQCSGGALSRLNAALAAGFRVKMQMAAPEQLAAMASLLQPSNAHLYGRILAVEEALFLPLLARVIAEGVSEGVFDTFDAEGVADMIYGLAARTNSKILDVLRAADEASRAGAIDILTTRFTLHGIAVDRILGVPDGSVITLTRGEVEAMVAALPRSFI